VKPSTPTPPVSRLAWGLFAGLFLIYNANGREISSYDSQPTKFAAVEFVRAGTLTLDRWVQAAPDLGQRSAFQRDRQGHYRSAYSVVPSLEAATVAWVLRATKLLDPQAPLGPAMVAVLTASLLTAGSVTLVFLALARRSSTAVALLVAIGLGLGTNLWPLASRTLWQLETVSFGLALALYGWLRPRDQIGAWNGVIGAAGLALAGSARPQIAPIVAVLLASLVVRIGWRRAVAPAAIVVGAAAVLMGFQWTWFGDVLGAVSALQAQSIKAHAVTTTISATPWIGAAGLLFSPSRGLLVFSPIVLLAIGAIPSVWRARGADGERWWTAAAIAQFASYACYSMWWGGHTYGPRYLVDLLIPLTPAAAIGATWAARRTSTRIFAWTALAVSIAVAATGAFYYPNDRWNNDPDVDLNHERLWDWHDPQVVRCWRQGPSPQNFDLFDAAGFRRPPGS
jgi:hypothetical protein